MFFWIRWRRKRNETRPKTKQFFYFSHSLCSIVLFNTWTEFHFVLCTEYYFNCLNCDVVNGFTVQNGNWEQNFDAESVASFWFLWMEMLFYQWINQTNKWIGIGHCDTWGVLGANWMLNTKCNINNSGTQPEVSILFQTMTINWIAKWIESGTFRRRSSRLEH